MPPVPKWGSLTIRALQLLDGEPMSAGDFGARLWKDVKRVGRVSAVQGGGDYAAQMFLGRLKKRGYVRVQADSITSVWEITGLGINALAASWHKLKHKIDRRYPRQAGKRAG